MHYIQRKKQSVPQSLPQWLKEEPPQIKWKETSNYSQTSLTNNPCFLSFSLVEQLPQNLVLQPLRTAQAAAYIYWA